MKQADFFIPYRFPGLNELISADRTNRYAGAAIKKECTDIATVYAKKCGVKFTKPVERGFLYIEPNAKRDPDNIISAKKFILDGMVQAGMIPNDTQKYIKFIAQDEWAVAWDGEVVGVHVQVVEYVNTNHKRFSSLDN